MCELNFYGQRGLIICQIWNNACKRIHMREHWRHSDDDDDAREKLMDARKMSIKKMYTRHDCIKFFSFILLRNRRIWHKCE